jgi:anti-anti-sigma factor
MEATVHGAPVPPGTDRDALTVQVDLVTATIAVTGELDRERVHLLVDATATLASTSHRSWVLDASGITFCDAGGLRAVVAAAATTHRRGGELTVAGANRSLRRLLTIVGLVDLLPDGAGPDTPGRQAGTRASSPGGDAATAAADTALPSPPRDTGASSCRQDH